MIDILSRRYIYFAFSLLVIIPGLVLLGLNGLPLSIDFTGGSLLEVQFEAGKTLQPSEVVALYETAGIPDGQVQTTESGSLLVRSSFLDNEARDQVLTEMESPCRRLLTRAGPAPGLRSAIQTWQPSSPH